jgi:cytochrome c oxidase subunit IV
MNPVLTVFALGELKFNESFLYEDMLKLNGFVFLLRMMIYQVVIGGVYKMGMFTSILLLATELCFVINNVKNYMKFKHFRKKIMIVGKIIQGVCLTVFMAIMVILADKNINSIEPVPKTP